MVVLLAAGGVVAFRWWSHAQGAEEALTVRYRTESPARTDVAKPWVEVVNTSDRSVDLTGVTVRYHYKADDGVEFAANCVRTSLGCSSVIQRTAAERDPDPKADHYLEVGFTGAAGTLEPGGTTEAIGLQLYRVDHKKLDQSDDYSFDASMTTYQESERITAYLDGTRVWGEAPGGDGPDAGRSAGAGSAAAPARVPAGVLFDDFSYTGPRDPALAANGWAVRRGEGGPGIEDSWSAKGITFPAGEGKDGGQALRLEAGTDGTKKGTLQSELHTARPMFREGTVVARVHLSDKPVSGRDGDHVSQSFFAISPDHASKKYSELDFEYMPNGGWGRYGPILDTTSWRDGELDAQSRVTKPHELTLAGWHTLAMTAVDGKVTYSVDGKALFTSGSLYFPREAMNINFSNWFVDLPFKGKRSWGVDVDWLYVTSGKAVSPGGAAKAAADFAAAGTRYVNTLPGK
ncbi:MULTISPECIES: cellulose binding domain-containing protein [unclassified Streptomyces]|uniref:cellulose binding domain-containing protein n=1 Tax=unclassified Streptomyces TaxID=2593676 RepID=UPI00278C3247|nr:MULTISPECIES: cellulose binding domain-containing protein [unclassified Streptomyces]